MLQWLNIEKNELIQMDMVEDSTTAQDSTAETSDQSLSKTEDEKPDQPQPLTSVHVIYGIFQDLESMAIKCQVEGVTIHLRRARLVFSDSKLAKCARKRQLLITEAQKISLDYSTRVVYCSDDNTQ